LIWGGFWNTMICSSRRAPSFQQVYHRFMSFMLVIVQLFDFTLPSPSGS
jgi:hypothetical protein